MKIQTLLKESNEQLIYYSKTSKLDVEILLSEAIKKNREYLIINCKKKVKNKNIKLFKKMLNKRKKGEPIAYILNKKEFWRNNFYVDKNVLIPRPDTEVLVEEVLKLFNINLKLNVLDIGTGSGCILLSILNERKNFYGTGIDISKKAIKVAIFNAKMHQLSNRVDFYHSDVDKFLFGKYDLIVSNPPYIKDIEILSLDKDVKLNEPKLALSGGKSGLNKVFKVIKKSQKLLKTKGKLILEVGDKQSKEVKEYLTKNNFNQIQVFRDLSRKDRCIVSTKAN